MLRDWTLIALAAAFGHSFEPSRGDESSFARALDGVSIERIRADLEYLASDELRGRDTPSPGLELAAQHIVDRLEGMGVGPGSREGYLHRWPRTWAQLDADRSVLELELERGDARALRFGEDYFLMSPRELGDLTAEGELVSAGDGDGGDLRRRIRGRWGVVRWPEGSLRVVARRAREAGAVGLLVLPDREDSAARFAKTTASLLDGRFASPEDDVFPTPILSREAAGWLLAPHDGELPRAGTALGRRAREVRRPTHAGGYRLLENVAGWWPGSDSKLAREVIVVSAHYDHVGAPGGRIHNGADDNASGTSGLLALAEALTRNGPLRRSVLLLWVSGEEKGLLGSKAWTRRPWLPEGHRPVCAINIDMIGRNGPEDLCITPTKRLREHTNRLVELAGELAPGEGFPVLRSADAYWRRSDHMNFAVHLDLPVAFLFADVHADYHQPTDDAERIDYDKVRRVTRLVLRILEGLQEDPLRLHRREAPAVEEFQARVRGGWIEDDLERLNVACRAHAAAHGGRWPRRLSELDSAGGPVLDLLGGALPRDPWGRAYQLDVDRDGEGGELSCFGSDGRRGGRREAADVVLDR